MANKFFSLKYGATIGGEVFRPAMCYPMQTRLEDAIGKLVQKDMAAVYEQEVRFVSGAAVPVGPPVSQGEKLEQERLEQEKREQEKARLAKLEQERLEFEKLEQARLEVERLEQEKAEEAEVTEAVDVEKAGKEKRKRRKESEADGTQEF